MNEQRCSDGSGAIVVKFMAKKLTAATKPTWRRQLPDGESKWGRCKFVFDQDCQVYDWLAVYDDLSPVAREKFSERIEPLFCPAENTILITAEPSSIKTYSSEFCRQFGVIITSQEAWAIEHEHIVRTQTAYPWFYGRSDSGMMSFDQIMNNPPGEKSRLISTVCSSKLGRKHTLHRARFEFTERLEKVLPEIDRFGKGVRYLNDKAEVLDSYRYHVAARVPCAEIPRGPTPAPTRQVHARTHRAVRRSAASRAGAAPRALQRQEDGTRPALCAAGS